MGGNLVERILHGGSILVRMPETYVDLRMFRQVPDHQDAFVDSCDPSKDSSHIGCGGSFIVELLEMDISISTHGHFLELCVDNGCKISEILVKGEDNGVLIGYQRVPKYGQEPDDIIIYLRCIRVEEFTTDVLITWSIPATTIANVERDQKITFQKITDTEYFKHNLEMYKKVFETMCGSINKNTGLFSELS